MSNDLIRDVTEDIARMIHQRFSNYQKYILDNQDKLAISYDNLFEEDKQFFIKEAEYIFASLHHLFGFLNMSIQNIKQELEDTDED